ncbi:unnamed protein product [Rhizoctonia solani]|uniref:PNPLA domain-containing protein n=1 Tax=Rhizoctonia solani TaxID=456999 RepID=A0A8H2WHI7_9AGAM|nr:unnamed protein product [Rhizoctonia solani]
MSLEGGILYQIPQLQSNPMSSNTTTTSMNHPTSANHMSPMDEMRPSLQDPVVITTGTPLTRRVGEQGPLRLLCVDGGGIRGLSSLVMLKEFLSQVKNHEDFIWDGKGEILPCEYFDMICGTSTGGLIAIMLGKLRMTVNEAIRAYIDLSKSVFSEKKWIWKEGRYSAQNLKNAILHIIEQATRIPDGEKRNAEELMMRGDNPDPNACKVFVCAANTVDATASVHFRTYTVGKHEREDVTIWEAARATTAAPYFFKPLIIQNKGGRMEGGTYIDAGITNNNPIRRLISEARLVWPGRSIGHILSLGTGQKEAIHLPRAGMIPKLQLFKVLHLLQRIATDCERVHQEVYGEFAAGTYFRFNVDRGLEGVGLDEWNSIETISFRTLAYMQRGEIDTMLQQAVTSFLAYPFSHLPGN